MNNYDVRIYNEVGCELYRNVIVAENENKALLKLLKDEDVIIYSGDNITIEEV